MLEPALRSTAGHSEGSSGCWTERSGDQVLGPPRDAANPTMPDTDRGRRPTLRRAFVWLVRGGDGAARRNGLLALGGYYVLSSLVDLAALAQGIVGPASVSSVAIRIAVGVVCFAAIRQDGRKLDS
jgi:hypothetical protein